MNQDPQLTLARIRRGRSLKARIRDCHACPLSKSRTQAVPFTGPSDFARSTYAFVGEAPGRVEDETGLPFKGPAGQLLNTVLAEFNLSRSDVYVFNTVSCRPPGNVYDRARELGAVEACGEFLRRQVEFSGARVIITMGNNAYRALSPVVEGGISKVRGKPVLLDSRRVLIPTYHPAYVLRGGAQLADIIADLRPWLTSLPPLSSSDAIAHRIAADDQFSAALGELLGLWHEARVFESKSPVDQLQSRLEF